MDWSKDQLEAMQQIHAWRSLETKPYLTLGGYAGTGKTSIIAEMVEELHKVAVCAFCGKAAQVLRQKGVPATTIHSLIYTPWEDAHGKIRYRRKQYLDGVKTIIVDEASMVDHLLFQDLMAFGLPILFVGDHGQLEPIGTNPGLMKEPDIKLEEIHRQEEKNPIIRLAAALREGRPTPYWDDPNGRLLVCPRRQQWPPDQEDWYAKNGWQIICGFNETRHRVNAKHRKLLGHTGTLCPGERVICLQNNKTLCLFNGQQMTVKDVGNAGHRYIEVTVETEEGRTVSFDCLREQFGKNTIEDFRNERIVLLDYAYAVTCHKSQGSEYPCVVVLEEVANAWDRKRWAYTAATRAVEQLVYCL